MAATSSAPRVLGLPGHVVLFRMPPGGPIAGEIRPAIVLRTRLDSPHGICARLTVFTDGIYDGVRWKAGIVRLNAVLRGGADAWEQDPENPDPDGD